MKLKCRKLLVIFQLPALPLLLVFGWLLKWIGAKKK